ncbi:hypothetical protein EROM_091840 [Encephalitozoon romaleae SJ-2008]|uniref:Cullin N-terminal domain-containing protein n=1 Tax=Encephalitozoon romaleae (strain SJ-2008) TaxID=1178016 RepID=I7APL0_ENCRO|nr:hypothetical protein EROM_091840 [Encephalitozoon romaleae SJ-2008]AFN83799.1 hypothetical protein EROM_091840 [Encephalitozoon romaleae SJ-2008]
MKGYNQRLRESTVAMKNFVEEYLSRGIATSTCEEIYQISCYMSRINACRELLKVVRKMSRAFVDESIEKACEVDTINIGKYLYEFNFHWDRSMNLFRKVFSPITPVERGFIDKLSSRLFTRFVKGIEDKILEFITYNIREEIDCERKMEKANESGHGNCEFSVNKKQKLSQSGSDEVGKEVPDRFESLCRKKQISAIICILQSKGCFNMFSERIVGCLISALSSRINDESLDISGIKDLIDKYRNAEYMKDYFYTVESGLIQRIVTNYTDEEIFSIMDREDEMRLSVGFFCASNSEERLVEAIGMYCKKIIKGLSIDDFIGGYYWIYLKFREIENCKDDGYQKIKEGIGRSKRDVVNANIDCAVESVCTWTDSLLRGRIAIKEDVIEGMEHTVLIPGTKKEVRMDTKKALKKIGMEEIPLESGVWREFLLSNIFEMIGEIFHFCNNKEVFEMSLQNKLGNRLVSRSSISTEWENLLIDRVDPSKCRLNKMRCMIKDFSERKLFMEHEILLLRACKWPKYDDVSLGIRDAEEIKEKYRHMVKNKRKIIKWNDLLSSCEVEFLGRVVMVTLVQYLIIKLLAEGDRDIDNLKVCKTWDRNLEVLVRKGLVKVKERIYSLNLNFWEENYSAGSLIPHTFVLQEKPEATKMSDGLESYKDLLDCKIVKEMKSNRVLNKSELRELLGRNHPLEILDERIESLACREFLSIEGENIKYLP